MLEHQLSGLLPVSLDYILFFFLNGLDLLFNDLLEIFLESLLHEWKGFAVP